MNKRYLSGLKMIINRNIQKVEKIVEKQIAYLSGGKSNYYFNKNHYSYYFSHNYDSFSVGLTVEEQQSGSCWSELHDDPKEYSLNVENVHSAIRFVLSVILPKMKQKELNTIMFDVFKKMTVTQKTCHEYYGNYETTNYYKISVSNIYEIINEYLHKNMNKIDKIVNI